MKRSIMAFLIIWLSVGCEDSSAPRNTDELYYAWLFGLIPTQDGGYLTAVTRYHVVHVSTTHPTAQHIDPSSTYGDMTLIKTDAAGNRQWEKVLEKPDAQDGIKLVQLPNGNYLLAGNTTTRNSQPQTRVDVDLNEVGPNGQERSSARLPNPGTDMRLTDLQVGPSGSLFAAGGQINPVIPQGWLRRVGQDGHSTQWEILTTGPPQDRASVEALAVGPDGELFVAGYESGYTYVKKISADGAVRWTQYASDSLRLSPRQLYATADGGFLLQGYAFSTPAATNPQVVLLKADASGKTQSIQWSNLGSIQTYDEHAVLAKRLDRNFLLATWDTNRKIDLTVLDANGGSPKTITTAITLSGFKKPLFLPLTTGETILVELTGSRSYEREITMRQIGADGNERWQRVIATL
ncbi:hypothetical protein J2I47_09435 [Fibrella sp. HMF5335]|uniref:Lipoprotein n=1 Tax=Fibrella rubiginis TaxID=2817060 RepID=A0A939GFC5_9BACT|nr:hypothetical protein [Fibrella rubiginis]MBO0936763.1 hypothetical protein [Fibrella rubiginis]